MTIKANTKEKSAVKLVEDLLAERAKMDAKLSKEKKKIVDLAEGVSEIDQKLLQLAEENLDDWWPDNSKTAEFDNGKLIWRASSQLVTSEGEPVTEENTDLVKLANRKGFRHLVRLSPVLNEWKSLIKAGKLPTGFESIKVAVTDKFSVTSNPPA